MQITIETELTRQTWQYWRNLNTKPRLTWLELHKLAEHLTKLCREQEHDFQQIDFRSLIDSQLDYYENLDALDVQMHMLGVKNLQDFSLGTGTEKLRVKFNLLQASYSHMKKRLAKQKRQNAKLKLRLKRKRRRKRKVSS